MRVQINQLKPGDIIVIKHNGQPYHAAIYAPTADKIGDVIHMGSGFKRTGAIRGTLASMCHLHRNLNWAGNLWNFSGTPHQLDIQVFRSKTLDGEAIAKQAEFWMHQGVTYDERRLLDSVICQNKPQQISDNERALNVFTYLKFSARRETAPIKTPFFPNPAASILAAYGSLFMAPSLNLSLWLVNFGLWCISFGTKNEGRVKGFSCAGFVLACIAAVALKDEIGAVNAETGWVSLKYGVPINDQKTAYATEFKKIQSKLGPQPALHPGLHSLLSKKQQQQFDSKRLSNKLSFIADLHPHHPSINAFNHGIQNDANWENVGLLDELKLGSVSSSCSRLFDKRAYHQEKVEDDKKTLNNHQQFGKDFGDKAFIRSYKRPLSQKMVTYISGEEISDITPYRNTL